MNIQHSSFHQKACHLAKIFAKHKDISFEVGYRWAKDFLQEAFKMTSHDWGCHMFDLCPEHQQLAQWVHAFITEHKPLSRSISRRFFWKNYFMLNEATLDPRPESEGLVQLALDYMPHCQKILELGVGSGCILLSILQEMPLTIGIGVDVQPRALSKAAENAKALAVQDRVQWIASDWYDALSSCGLEHHAFDLIISNPPYIATNKVTELPLEVRKWDPSIALDGGMSGIEPYLQIIPKASQWLSEGGMLMLEIPEASMEMLSSVGRKFFNQVQAYQDIFQRWRYLAMC